MRARQFAPLYDGGAIKLTARAVRKVSNDYKFRLELCAHALSLPATIADLMDGPGPQEDRVLVVQRRTAPHARLLAQAWQRKVQCQVSNVWQPVCAHAQAVHSVTRASLLGQPSSYQACKRVSGVQLTLNW